MIRNRPIHIVGGEKLTVSECARRAGIARSTLDHRLARGMTIEQAMGEPVRGKLDTETLYCIIWNEVADEIEDDLPANRLAHAILNALRAAGAV